MQCEPDRPKSAGRGPEWKTLMEMLLVGAGIVLVFLAFLFRVRHGLVRFFEPDEFEALHSAWLMLQGQVPYADFPALHPYPFWGLLMPIVALFHGDPGALILAARGLLTVLAGGILLLTWRLGRRWFGSPTGLVAVLGLAFMFMFIDESTHVRGTIPAVCCWLGALDLLFDDLEERGSRRPRAVWAGLLLGLGFVIYQSPLPLAAAAGICLWHAWATGTRDRLPRRLLLIGGGFAAVVGLALLPLLFWGVLDECWRQAVVWHLSWFRLPPTGYIIRSLFRENTIFWLFGLGGILAWFGTAAQRDPRRPGLALAACLLGLMFVILPKPLPHHFLPLLPLLALAGADLIVGLARAALVGGRNRLLVALVALGLVLTGIYVPATDILARRTVPSTLDLQIVRYIHRVTEPGTPVGGGAGMGLLRPDAGWMWFLPNCGVEVIAPIERLPGDLRRGQVPVFICDTHMLRVLHSVVGTTMQMGQWSMDTGLDRAEAARLDSYRRDLLEFLQRHYVHGLLDRVLVAGYVLEEGATEGCFDLVAPGRYRAQAAEPAASADSADPAGSLDPAVTASLTINGRAATGGEWELKAGRHEVRCAAGHGGVKIAYVGPIGE